MRRSAGKGWPAPSTNGPTTSAMTSEERFGALAPSAEQHTTARRRPREQRDSWHHSNGSTEEVQVKSLGKPEDGAQMRAKDVIFAEIRSLCQSNPTLQVSDFDYRVRQHLHAIYGSGGLQRLIDGLAAVHTATAQKQRSDVKNWPAYLGGLLRKFASGEVHEAKPPQEEQQQHTQHEAKPPREEQHQQTQREEKPPMPTEAPPCMPPPTPPPKQPPLSIPPTMAPSRPPTMAPSRPPQWTPHSTSAPKEEAQPELTEVDAASASQQPGEAAAQNPNLNFPLEAWEAWLRQSPKQQPMMAQQPPTQRPLMAR